MANDLSLTGSTLLGRLLFPGGREIFRAAARRVCLVTGSVVALAFTTLGPGRSIQHGRQHVAGAGRVCSPARHTKQWDVSTWPEQGACVLPPGTRSRGRQHAGWAGRTDLPPGTGSAAGAAAPGSTGR